MANLNIHTLGTRMRRKRLGAPLSIFALLCVAVSAPEKSIAQRSQVSVDRAKCAFLRKKAGWLRSDLDSIARLLLRSDAADRASDSAVVDVATSTVVLDSITEIPTLPVSFEYFKQSEILRARLAILASERSACDRGIQLSNSSRVPEITRLAERQAIEAVKRLRSRFTDIDSGYAVDLASALAAVFRLEQLSFYPTDGNLAAYSDPDIAKSYPVFVAKLSASNVDSRIQRFFLDNLRELSFTDVGQISRFIETFGPTSDLGSLLRVRANVQRRLDQSQLSTRQREDSIRRFVAAEDNSRFERYKKMAKIAIASLTALVLLALLLSFPVSRRMAKYRAFKSGLNRVPYFFGAFELILWDPGETVVLLKEKRLEPIADPHGGFRTISAWRGEEYKGRINYRTQLSTWHSDPIFTSDGLSITLSVGIWWRITNANTYVSAISSHYHSDDKHHREVLHEAAEVWIQKLTGGTLREHVNQLQTSTLISPFVQQYLHIKGSLEGPLDNFSQVLARAQGSLDEKTKKYGIEVERLEVQELKLPDAYRAKLEAVRVAFLEPDQARAMTEAQKIALQGLADIIGADRVGLIEILKHYKEPSVSLGSVSGSAGLFHQISAELGRSTKDALAGETRLEDVSRMPHRGKENVALPPDVG